MKVVLTTMPKEGSAIQWVTPKYFQPDDSKYVPLGLLSLATNIPQHYDIKVLDPGSKGWGLEETIQRLEAEKPDVLGLSSMTLSAYQMREILQRTTAPYKVVGGPHTTHNSEIILEQGADAVFVGPLADNEFAEAIETKRKGTIYCKTPINDLKFPDRSFVDLDSYTPVGNLFKSHNRVSMFSGIGCPYRCTFCDVQTKKVQRKDPKFIIDEMEYIKDLGAGSIHVYEDNFNTDDDYLISICDEMDRRNFRSEWSGRGQIRNASLEIASMLAERGFKRMHVGIEAFSDETLRFFRKGQKYSQIESFCNIMNQVGIDIIGFFIVGAPTETEEDRRTMFSKIKSLGIKYPLVNILQPLPNTELYYDLLKDGTYERDYWAEHVKNPKPNFMLPFPYGKKKWEADAAFVEGLTQEFEKWKEERGD